MTQPRTQGGYRQPRRPAPASGPGRLSRRTDGGPGDRSQPIRDLPNPDYGEQQTFRDIQGAAPMAPETGQAGPPVQPVDTSRVTALNSPSSRPQEPVTSGADAGPGPSSAALGVGATADPGVRAMAAYLPGLEKMADMPHASQGFRMWVRQVRALI